MKEFKAFITKQNYKLDKEMQDSLLGTMIIYDNKFNQSVLKQTTQFVTGLTFVTPVADTMIYVNAATTEGYNFRFAIADDFGNNSYYFKGQSTLIIRRFKSRKQGNENWMIMVQNSGKEF